MIETNPVPPINRNAVTGFISALLALLVLCTGILPIPFAFILCYPLGILFAVTSFVLGIKSQREIHRNGDGGRLLAVLAVWIGGLVLFVFACMITLGAILLPRVTGYISQFIN